MSTVRRPTTCQNCLCDCGLLAVVEDGRVVRVEGDRKNPQSRGGMCIKGAVSPDILYAPDRLLRPQRRGAGGELETVSWDRALGEIGAKLLELRDRYGPESVCLYYGRSTRFIDRAFISAFGRLFGTPNVTGVWSLCVGSKVVGYRETFGPPLMPSCDFRNARLIVLWGTNPTASRMHRYFRVCDDILAAQKAGAKLVVIDPRAHALAQAADVHLALNPGTDLHLALALARLLVDQGGYDEGFVRAHTEGFDELREHLKTVDVAEAAAVSGVSLEAILELARDLAEIRPASIDRREGTIHQTTGSQMNRALAILCALTGNVDVPGGLTFNPTGQWRSDLGIRGNKDAKPFWGQDFPLALDASGALPRAILTGKPHPIKALVCVAANPATVLPDSETTARALRSLELLVVDDLFLTETSRLAHYVLPGATFFEKGEFEVGPFKQGQWVKVTEPVIEPLGEARAEWRVMAELADRIGCPELKAFADEDEVMRRVFDDSGHPDLDPKALRRGRLLAPLRHGALLEGGFKTPSGKIQLAARGFEAVGASIFPSPEDACPTTPEYPLRLITGSRVDAFTHSQHRNIPRLLRLCPEPRAEISEEIARGLSVRDGDRIRVETPWGSMELEAGVAEGMNPATVSVPHGWPGRHNVNQLLSLNRCDPLSATPAYKAVPCRVEKVHTHAATDLPSL